MIFFVTDSAALNEYHTSIQITKERDNHENVNANFI